MITAPPGSTEIGGPDDAGAVIAPGGRPPAGWRPPRAAHPPRLPKPPRRPPRSATVLLPLGPRAAFGQLAAALVAAIILGLALNLMVFGHLQHTIAQQNLENSFRAQLASGTAPVSEGTVDDVLLGDGDPVAVLDIPAIGVHEVVVEGSSSVALKQGPGHRRDTVLPGQAGLSILMGRAAAYGGPFSRIQELAPGEVFSVTTGQGVSVFEVIGVRYAGDVSPPSPVAGESRLILETARGPAYIPTGIARVDARLVSETQPAGQRQTSFIALPPSNKELAPDLATVWALVFALQLLVVVELAGVWAFVHMGARRTWVVFAPVALLAGLVVADQISSLLPNLL